MQAVVDTYLIFSIKGCFNVSPLDLSINDVTEHNMTVTTSTSDGSSIMTPWETQDWATQWLVKGVRPSRFIAESKHFEWSDSEVVSVWWPLNGCDNVIIWWGIVKLSSVLVPHSVFAVFTAWYYQVVCWVPVASKYNTVMGFPRVLFVSWKGWNNGDVLLRAIQERIVFRTPTNCVDWFIALNKLWSEHTTSWPNLD